MSEYAKLPEIGTNLGYKWEPIQVGVALANLLEYFKRNNARAFMVDVYASNDSMYRNIVIQLPLPDGPFSPNDMDIEIQFERDKGRQLLLTRV